MNEIDTRTKQELQEAKRQELVARVKQAEANLETRGQRIRSGLKRAQDNTSAFVVRNPMTSLGGGILLGIAIGSLLPRPRTRPSGAELARMIGDYGRAYFDEARHMAERGLKAGRDALEDLDERSEEFREDAAEGFDELRDEARSFSRAAGKSTARILGKLRGR